MAWTGAAIGLVGALFFALGAALQQREVVRVGSATGVFRRPLWLLGSVIGLIGGTMHYVALSFAPLSLIQPMGVASVMFAVPIAAMLYGRRAGRAELVGAAAVTTGLIVLVLLVPSHAAPPLLSPAAAVGLLLAVGVVASGLLVGARRVAPVVKALMAAGAAGAVFGAASALVRVLAPAVARQPSALLHWITLAVPVLIILAVMLNSTAYTTGHFAVSYATVQVSDPIIAVAIGVLLLGERLPTDPLSLATAAIAAASIVAGTVTLARHAPVPASVATPATRVPAFAAS